MYLDGDVTGVYLSGEGSEAVSESGTWTGTVPATDLSDPESAVTVAAWTIPRTGQYDVHAEFVAGATDGQLALLLNRDGTAEAIANAPDTIDDTREWQAGDLLEVVAAAEEEHEDVTVEWSASSPAIAPDVSPVSEVYLGDTRVWPVWEPVDLDLESAITSPYRIVFAGSSTTQGWDQPRFESYPHVMTARFARSVVGAHAHRMRVIGDGGITTPTAPGFHFLNVGWGGTTAANYLASPRDANATAWNPHLIVHMIGSNDYAEQMPIATYQDHLRTQIERWPNAKHVLAHSWERLDVSNPSITWDEYGSAMRRVATEYENTAFVDASQTWEDRQEPGVDYLKPDLIHGTWQGTELLAHCVADGLDMPLATTDTVVWATDIDDPDASHTHSLMDPSSESRIQEYADGSGHQVNIVSLSGERVFNFSYSGARYADTPAWPETWAMPLAFYIVVHTTGSNSHGTSVAPYFSRSVAGDDGWWWVWRDQGTNEIRAALNSAFSPPAIGSTPTKHVIAVQMQPNNRARVWINSTEPITTLGPDTVDETLGPWMKSLRIGANSGTNFYTNIRMKETGFLATGFDEAPVSDLVADLAAKHNITLT